VSAGVDDDLETVDAETRWSWVFWGLVVSAAVPLALSMASVHRLLVDETLMAQFTGDTGLPPMVFADRWDLVVALSTVRTAPLLTSFAVLVLAGIVASGRPGWLVVPHARPVVTAVAVVCAVWTAATAALTARSTVGGPTAWQVARAETGWTRSTWLEWAAGAGLELLAVVVALVAVTLLVVTRARHPRTPAQAPT
jgi:hypothetical protein